MFTKKQEQLIRDFGAQCYWYGEDTGDYDMHFIDDLIEALWKHWALLDSNTKEGKQ